MADGRRNFFKLQGVFERSYNASLSESGVREHLHDVRVGVAGQLFGRYFAFELHLQEAPVRPIFPRYSVHTVHDLRHYYASVLLALNIPNKYAQRRMGHATDGMLKKVYQHLMDEKITETDEKIDEYFKDFIPAVNTKSEHEK